MSKINRIKNLNLGSRDTKMRVLKYLYSTGINMNIKHNFIAGENDLNAIRDNDYVICPRFSGTRSWIIFFKGDDDVYYAVNFPKHGYKKREEINIFPVNVSVSEKFYNGTIMEGIYFKMDKKRYLIVDELYMLKGHNQLLKSKTDRLDLLTRKFKKSVMVNPTYSMLVSQYFHIDKQNIKELYDKIKSDISIQEIIFYPNTYGKKIYSYTIIDHDLIDNVIKVSQLFLEKTSSPDVYNIYYINSDKKIDVAYIPDMETSKKCKQWFKETREKKLLVKCKKDMINKKWIPVELIEQDLLDNSDSENSDLENSDSENLNSDLENLNSDSENSE
ncbi:putative mRNA-capping enzyme [Cotonvirus japonicus]|uniref:mRNA-capping enzyme n=1 Tax=Cotonvirus japonicus TaxID=2811091 RepID=A0ABM7NSY0_9VIRU|nr:putative mRNA-capping enzyme [Cotonvirus japonicus]BCS83284.1 putative mRNA-capping enzyme [Cotonvirus japonicus]